MIEKLNALQSQAFTGNKKIAQKNLSEKSDNSKPNQVVIVSKDGSKALRNYAMATIAALGLSTASPVLTGCSDAFDPEIEAYDSLKQTLGVDYHPIKLDPETLIVYKYLPGDTIRDTIEVVKPGPTVYVEPDYKADAADSLIAHGKNLGFEFEGEGSIPVRMNVFDQFNSTNHDLVLDGKSSSEEKMVFIDEAKDYSKDSKNPTVRYNRIEFAVDNGRGVTNHIFKSPVDGIKPSSAAAWVEAAKTCMTNYKNGFVEMSSYEKNGDLTPIGNLEKSNEKDVDFYENLFNEFGDVDTYSWSEAKMKLANPKK